MAFLQLTTSCAYVYANTSTCDFYSTHRIFIQKRKNVLAKKLSCRAAKDQEEGNRFSSEGGKFDRRGILLGLGGLYGTTAVGHDALAVPVESTNCGVPETLPSGANITKFVCPPPIPIEYTLSERPLVRTRPAAHSATEKDIASYNRAIAKMRSLPYDDPHSLAAQAAIHCAYCDSAYEMVGFPNLKLQIHNNWLFFPFHRWYLYFYEKIVHKYAEDENFAIPYWNWDLEAGMGVPAMFTDRDSALYDKLRNEKHVKLNVDLNYSSRKVSPTGQELVNSNYNVMHKQMVSVSTTTELFLGKKYQGGQSNKDNEGGAIERQPHTQLHIWTGDPNQRYGEDMGRFYSAGRDPIFYAHHANVDRLWNIWKTLPGDHAKDIVDTDCLESSFVFYDENKRLVRVKVRDCVDTEKMGYKYPMQDPDDIPWFKFRPTEPPVKLEVRQHKSGEAIAAEIPNTSPPQVFPNASEVFPSVLDGLVKVTVIRPKKSRTKEEIKDKEEILVINGIEHDGGEYIDFDVFLNSENEVDSGPNSVGFAGSYSNVPLKENDKITVSMSVGITEILNMLGADDDEKVAVALVPRSGDGKVTIGSIKIKLAS